MFEKLNCCGIAELDGISESNRSPQNTLQSLFEDMWGDCGCWECDEDCGGKSNEYEEQCAFIIFSDTERTKFKYGLDLAEFIKKNKLGTVGKTRAKINPNSNNKIIMWTWSINLKAFAKWGLKNN